MINVAVLWLINNSGEFLLARRADHKKQDPGVWGPSVTGKMETGETFDETLRREVEEELSLKPNQYNPKYLLNIEYDHPDGEKRRFCIYYTQIEQGIPLKIRFNADEVAEIRWFTKNQLSEMLRNEASKLVPSALDIWPKTFTELEKATNPAADKHSDLEC